MARSTPTKISIPAIDVSAPVDVVGLAPDGAIGAPPLSNNNLAGWYSGGPSPGQTRTGGDRRPRRRTERRSRSSTGSASCKPGDKVQVDLANHRVAMFSIYSVEYYPKGKFPGDRVYRDYSRPGLRLITCGGELRRRLDRLRRQHRGLRVDDPARLRRASTAGRCGRPVAGSSVRRERAGRASPTSAGRAYGDRAHATPGRAAGAGWRMQPPTEFGERPVALAVVAARARRDHVVPSVLAAPAARHHVVDGLGRTAAVGTATAVTSEDRAAGQADMGAVRYPDVAGQPDHARDRQGLAGAVQDAVAVGDADGLGG